VGHGGHVLTKSGFFVFSQLRLVPLRFWIAGLALLVLVEKLFPFGRFVNQITGSVLIGCGLFVLVH
jgi:hypothetical protein